ncbi:MAG: hypothetical protein AAFR53_02625 [Pseudomonadota bacterium]
MDFLNAALAFSVLMITLSTAATALSEAYLRLISQRPRVLAQAMLNFLKTDPRIEGAIRKVLEEDTTYRQVREWVSEAQEAAGEKAADARKHLRDRFAGMGAEWAFETGEEMLAAYAEYRRREAEKLIADARVKLVANPASNPEATHYKASTSVDTLTTYAFVQRLAETDIGKMLGRERDALAIKALTRSFERFTAASNEMFRKKARTSTMVAALVLAFTVNIPAGTVFDYVMENPELSGMISAQAQTALVANEKQLEDFNAALAALELDGEKAAEFDETDAAQLAEATKAVDAAVSDISATLEDARGLYGLPLGYSVGWYEDTCATGIAERVAEEGLPSPDRNFFKVFKTVICDCGRSPGWYFWLVNVLLSGVLIGLGGPFWYRVYSSLSHTAQLVRAFRGSPRPETLGAGSSEAQPIHHAYAHPEDSAVEVDEPAPANLPAAKEDMTILAEGNEAAPKEPPERLIPVRKPTIDDQLYGLFQVSLPK